MPNNKQGQLKIWGRANSVNVQKVLWCLRELDLAYERIDAGMAFGRNHDPDYLAMNPNARVPTLVDGDYVLWESNSSDALPGPSPTDRGPRSIRGEPKRRAAVDRWLDWTLSTMQPVDRPVFWALVRTPVEKRDMVAIQKDVDAEAVQWRIIDAERWRRGASSRATISPSPISRWAPMPGAGSGSKASASPGWRISNAGLRDLWTARDSSNSSRRR